MELLDRIRSTQRPLAEIRSQTRESYDTLLAASPRIAEGNFTSIHSDDLETLFELYDELFFDGQLEPATRADGSPLSFRVSKRMTRVGGTTTKYRHQQTVGPQMMSYEIAISSTLLFSTFYDVERPISVTGVECGSKSRARNGKASSTASRSVLPCWAKIPADRCIRTGNAT